jgi:multiple sugar transport system substrate-binding protein
VQPLDGFVASSTSGWDFPDFTPSAIAANRWTGVFGDAVGTGPLLGIPVNCESYNLAYNAPVLEELALPVPTTWDEYFAASRRIVEAHPEVRGFAQRGLAAWHTMYTGFATQLWSYGGADFGADGGAAIGSPESLTATRAFIGALQQSGPADWTEQRWFELAMDFRDGRYGLIVDSDHYAPYYEAAESRLAGRIGYAPTPMGPTGRRTPNLWTWSLVMNARSRIQEAAWQFIEWASSSAFLSRAASEGNFNPTRASVWDSEAFLEKTAGWGDYVAVSRGLAEHDARVLVTPAVNYREVAEVWVAALRESYRGADLEVALAAAAERMDDVVDRRFGGL